jgi:hypothetical protein
MAEINLTEARRVLELTLAAYSDIRGRYWAAVYDSVYEYLTGTKPVTGYRNTHKREMLKAFTDAADAGWADGFPIDKEVPPMEAEQVALLTAEQNAELGYIELMWQRMAALKKGATLTQSTRRMQRRTDMQRRLTVYTMSSR